MQVQLKLMGILKDKVPDGGSIELADSATIENVLEQLEIPVDSVQVFTVNGSLIRDKGHVLSAGDELTVLPPVGGG